MKLCYQKHSKAKTLKKVIDVDTSSLTQFQGARMHSSKDGPWCSNPSLCKSPLDVQKGSAGNVAEIVNIAELWCLDSTTCNLSLPPISIATAKTQGLVSLFKVKSKFQAKHLFVSRIQRSRGRTGHAKGQEGLAEDHAAAETAHVERYLGGWQTRGSNYIPSSWQKTSSLGINFLWEIHHNFRKTVRCDTWILGAVLGRWKKCLYGPLLQNVEKLHRAWQMANQSFVQGHLCIL